MFVCALLPVLCHQSMKSGCAGGGPAEGQVDQGLLKLYIAYAKKNCHPKLQDADTEKMVQARASSLLLHICFLIF